jgi:hypothetical protein
VFEYPPSVQVQFSGASSRGLTIVPSLNAAPCLGRVEEAFGGGDDGLAQFLSKTLGSMLRLMRAMTEGGGDDMAAYMDMAQVWIVSASCGCC